MSGYAKQNAYLGIVAGNSWLTRIWLVIKHRFSIQGWLCRPF